MLEANIVPQIDVDENINQFCSYFRFTLPAAAILDSKDGIKSIAPTILKKPCCFKKFFAKREEQCTLNQLRGVLKYICSVEGSIDFEREEDAILEVELFLVSLENSESTIKVSDFFQFCAMVDRIPILGFTKPIEVFFTDRKMYPKSSTCGLTLTLQCNVTQEMLQTAIKDGGTFGDN